MDQEKPFELGDNSSYSTSSYAKFTVKDNESDYSYVWSLTIPESHDGTSLTKCNDCKIQTETGIAEAITLVIGDQKTQATIDKNEVSDIRSAHIILSAVIDLLAKRRAREDAIGAKVSKVRHLVGNVITLRSIEACAITCNRSFRCQ